MISQTELAEMLGCSFASVNRWEVGRRDPTIKMKRKLIELAKEKNVVITITEEEKNA